MVNVTIAYFATKWGFVPAATIATPWTTPPIINGWLATQSWTGGLLSVVLITISVCIYLPFVMMSSKAAKLDKTEGTQETKKINQ